MRVAVLFLRLSHFHVFYEVIMLIVRKGSIQSRAVNGYTHSSLIRQNRIAQRPDGMTKQATHTLSSHILKPFSQLLS